MRLLLSTLLTFTLYSSAQACEECGGMKSSEEEVVSVVEATEPIVHECTPEPEVVIAVKEVTAPDYQLSQVNNAGESLTLNDVSEWSVKKQYRDLVSHWQQGDAIRLTYEEVDWVWYRVELRNLSRNESAYATLSVLPVTSSSATVCIQEIQSHGVRLNNGVSLKTQNPDLNLSGWRAGDIVTFLYWGEVEGKPACALWNHEINAILGQLVVSQE